jgi:putative tryptophan/tyrosine transport system substrate-binding protein
MMKWRMQRREFISLLGGAAAVWPLGARAQQADRVRRVGFLAAGGPIVPLARAAFREELAKLGWIEGRNLQIDYRVVGAEPGRLAAGADELVTLSPDVIFAYTGAAARAAQQRTKSIPIVFVGGGDPSQSNLAGGIARPVGNITGFANNFASLGGKWLELLKQAAPHLTRVASVFDPDLADAGAAIRGMIEAAGVQLAIPTIRAPVRNPDDIARVINAFAAEPGGGLLLSGPQPENNLRTILGLALQHRLPTLWGANKLAADGLLMSNGPDLVEMSRGAASYVDRILRGAKPSDLPVQYPTKFPLVLNLKTARALGLDIQPTLLAIADEVIE